MKFLDWIQIVSLVLLVAALALNAMQLREIAGQSHALLDSLQQIAYGGVSDLQSDPRLMLFPDDTELLSWYLSSRGIGSTTPVEDKRRLYVMAKLIQHETNFINHTNRHLADESWRAWFNVLYADLQVVEFQEVWRATHDVHAESFATLVDSILAERLD